MNKSDLIDSISERVGGRQAATVAIEAFIDTVTRAVTKGERVAISGFGVFEKADRAARTGRNPATGAVVKIKKTSVPKFRPGTEFKAYVNGSKKFPRGTAAGAAKATARGVATKQTAAGDKAATKRPTASKAAAATKATARTTAAKKTTAVKTTAVKTTAAKTPAKKAPSARTTAAKAPAAKTATKRTTARKSAR